MERPKRGREEAAGDSAVEPPGKRAWGLPNPHPPAPASAPAPGGSDSGVAKALKEKKRKKGTSCAASSVQLGDDEADKISIDNMPVIPEGPVHKKLKAAGHKACLFLCSTWSYHKDPCSETGEPRLVCWGNGPLAVLIYHLV